MDAARLGFMPDTVIQELGWDDDVDEGLRTDIEKLVGNGLVDGDHGDVVDGVILWWRDGDDDLVDSLVDALQDLAEGGNIWLFTPKVGQSGYVPGADIAEAAPIAGLSTTTTSATGTDWAVTRLTSSKR